MLTHYYVIKETALRFASFETDMKQSRGFQVNGASALQCEMFRVFIQASEPRC